jgi:signal transduction histidine kinase
VKALAGLFAEYRYKNDSLADVYVIKGIEFASKTSYVKGYALALYYKGVFEGERGNFDSSSIYIRKALNEYKKINDLGGIAYCNMAFGFNEYDKANFSKALFYFLEATRSREKLGNSIELGGSYIWVGNVYNNGLSKPESALMYYKKALELQKSLGDETNMAYTYNNIGNVYYYLKRYDLSLESHLKGAEIKEKLDNRRGLSSSYDNIGNIYYDLKDYDLAFEYYQKALALRKEFADKKGISTSYLNIGNLFFRQKKYAESISYHTKAFDDASAIDNKEIMVEASNSLAANYEALGDFALAMNYYKQSTRLKDSMINSTFTQQIADMQTKYDVEKKDLELVKNKAELEAKEKQAFIKNIIIGSIILLAILLAIVAVLFFRKKQVEQQAKLDAEIAAQKEIRTKAILEAEEKERRRIAQDLHDGVGQLLSAAKLNLSNLDSKLPDKTTDQETAMHNALSFLDDSAKEVRTVSHNMMPNTLIKLGLATAIREFIGKLGSTPSLKIDLEIVGLDTRLDNQVETVLYRVIQEIVNNILKHSKASQISMQLIRHDTEMNVMIEDNGVGFDTTNIDSFEGLGLKGIKTRVELLEGSVHFDSAVGRGTTVIIDVPIS